MQENHIKNHTNMKKFTIFFASLMLISLIAKAQNERIILLESFTNTGCGPCATYNPGMDALINSNANKIAAIKYHVSWPSNQDPMYLHNTGENSARVSYYGVNSVPHVVVDGTRFSGNSGDITQSVINQAAAISSPLQMRLSWELNADQTTITVYVMGRVTTDITGSVKLYVGVIEKEIHFTSAPGPNGEKNFYQVMKKLLPNANGTSLGELNAGDYFTYTFTWDLANVYNNNQLDAIAWVQNANTKEVYQACKSSQQMVPFFANEACASAVKNVKSLNCSGEANPHLLLTNYGSNALTSAELEVFVNGESLKTMTWTGNLATLASELVDLGNVSFDMEDENLLEVRINSVNGGTDEAPSNNVASCEFDKSPEIVNKVLKLTIRTDAYPQETTWKLTNLTTGEVVLEGGPYDTPNHAYTEVLDVTSDGCYDFTIYDAGGNGLLGSGIYGLKASGSTLFSGKVFEYSESHEFSYSLTDDTEETFRVAASIYPNPTSGMVTIESDGEQAVTIYNMAGQRVYEGMSHGILQIDMKVYGAGIYAVKVGKETQRIVVK